ncbi:glutamyl-tRNA reductase [Alteromonadaceae bacterium M269]|nr:glutamyl-tRNA reductase [Alteromonadaceae bacterium M269]
MTLIAFGINHNTAPVEIREKVAFSDEVLPEAVASFKAHSGSSDVVIVSTCNRTEIYAQSEGKLEVEDVCEWLGSFHAVEPKQLPKVSYHHEDAEAVRHLMRVASGLDSLVLGEPQILGQIKQAYFNTKHISGINSRFERLFQNTFSIAKKVRTDTEIGANAVSVAFAAVQLAKHIFSDLSKSRVLLIGAGETIELVARHIKEQGVNDITVANRTLSRAQDLADAIGAKTITLSQIPSHMMNADIVFSSTASQLPILGKGIVERALKQRRHKPMFLVDLAVPRDIESEVSDLADAYLYTVDDLQHIVSQNLASRQQAAEEAEKIIDSQVQNYQQWHQSLDSLTLITDYRQQSEVQKQKLLDKALNQLSEGKDAEQIVKELANKLTNSLIHMPTKALKEAAQRQEQESLMVLAQALGLSKKE